MTPTESDTETGGHRLLGNAKGFQVGTVLYAADVALAGLSMMAIVQHVARSGLTRPGVTRAG